MSNRVAFTLGAAIAALVAAVVILQQRLETLRLRQMLAALQTEGPASQQQLEDQIVSTHVPQAPAPTIQAATEPSTELLRLRGEVTRLRLENENILQEKAQQLKDLLLTRGRPTLMESYLAMGIDTNTLPSIGPGSSTNIVFSELQRVSARIIEAERGFIHAEIPALAMSNNAAIPIDVVFYFDEGGRVTSQSWKNAQQ